MKQFQHFLILSLLWMTCFANLLGQCPPGSVYVYNQNQVNAFLANYPNCEEINGSLIISFQNSPNITDLTPFHNIKRVNGDFQAAELNSLTNLNGLQNLEFVQKSFRLNQIPLITSVTELKNLKEVGEFFQILNMNNLITIDSFESLMYVGKSFLITRSPKLQTISGFQKLETVNSGVTFELNPELLQIPSFPLLKHVGLSIKIVDAPKLKGRNIFPKLTGSVSSLIIDLNTSNSIEFSGFHHLDSIRTDLTLNLPHGFVHNAFQNLKFIGGNATITTNNTYFDFATELNQVNGYLTIRDCEYLKSIGSFSEVLSVGDYIALWNNSALDICNVPFICRQKELGKDLSIVGGMPHCSSLNAIDCSYEGISGTIYYDQNQNGLKDSNEEGISNMAIEVPEIGASFLSNLDGKYFFNAIDGNEYTIEANFPAGWQLTTEPSYTISFVHTDPENKLYDFGVYPDFDTSSIDIQLFGSEFRCSRYSTFDIKVENTGTYLEDGMVRIQYDAALTYEFSIPPPDSVNEELKYLSWDIKMLAPSGDQTIQVYFQNPPVLTNADSIFFEMDALIDNTAFYKRFSRQFLCNEIISDRKFVLPHDGSIDNFVSKDEEIIYSVEIQDNIINELRDVIVYDTLSSYLDMNTFKLLDHSHPIQTKVDGHAITFSFDEIYLLDTTYSVNQNQAFVTYSVKPLPEVANGSIIENTAYIFYDVIPIEPTNSVVSTIEGPTGIYNLSISPRIQIIPNPNIGSFTLHLEGISFNHQLEIQITNLQGQLFDHRIINSSPGYISFTESNFKPGIYLITIMDRVNQFRASSKFLIIK